MKIFPSLLIVLFWMVNSATTQAQDPNFHIYLAFGQSNMDGAGAIENQDRVGVDVRFKVMSAVNCTDGRTRQIGKWTTAAPPLVRCWAGLGISDYFGRTMVQELPSEIKIGIVPVAVPGCDIDLFDKVNYTSYISSAPSWMKDVINSYGGNPYGRLVEVANVAKKDGVIKGIIFHQGETNTNNPEWKNKVADVVKNLKIDLNLSDVPFLAGELLASSGACCGSHNVEVNKLPSLIRNAHVISSADLQGADGAHFTSASYREFGRRYAKKMIELFGPGIITSSETETLEKGITIYPVPSPNGTFTISNIERIKNIELLTMTGGKITSFENKDRSSILDIRVGSHRGIFLLKLSDGKSFFYKRVIVD